MVKKLCQYLFCLQSGDVCYYSMEDILKKLLRLYIQVKNNYVTYLDSLFFWFSMNFSLFLAKIMLVHLKRDITKQGVTWNTELRIQIFFFGSGSVFSFLRFQLFQNEWWYVTHEKN